jgi:hypothetical protein
VTTLERILDVLPPPYTADPASLLGRLLNVLALEAEAYQEDLEVLRRTHWVDLAERLADLEKLGALVGTARLSWETPEMFRSRLHATVDARLHGAVDPASIEGFVYSYLRGAEIGLGSTFVPGLPTGGDAAEAFGPRSGHPGYRPLGLVENPSRLRTSGSLAALAGRVPYLFRWQEDNRGLAETVPTFTVTGLPGGRTAGPLLANLTTGDLIGYSGVLRVGQRLVLLPAAGDGTRGAAASLDGRDVTGRMFSVSGFRMGVPFEPADADPEPQLPRMARGTNAWVFLSVGRYDVEGLDNVFYAIADEALREAAFDQTAFDESLFPRGPVAALAMEWTEAEPASFEVHVPRYLVAESPETAASDATVYEELGGAIETTVQELRAAGVRATVRFDPFAETQDQRVSVRLPWMVIPPEAGPVGLERDVSLSGQFGQARFTDSRFE